MHLCGCEFLQGSRMAGNLRQVGGSGKKAGSPIGWPFVKGSQQGVQGNHESPAARKVGPTLG